MTELLKLKDYKELLIFYKKKIPNNIFFIKKNAIKLLINKMCRTNCIKNKKYKFLLYLYYIKRAISDNKKNKNKKTAKKNIYNYKQTRIKSPI